MKKGKKRQRLHKGISQDCSNSGVINEEIANEKIDKIFSLLSQQKGKGSKKVENIKNNKHDLLESNVSTAIATLSNFFGKNEQKQHQQNRSNHTMAVTSDSNAFTFAHQNEWAEAIQFRLSLGPLYSFVLRLSLNRSAHTEKDDKDNIAQQRSARDSSLSPREDQPRSQILRKLLLSSTKTGDPLNSSSFDNERFLHSYLMEKAIAKNVHTYLQEIKNSLNARNKKSDNNNPTDCSIFTYDLNYWRQRVSKNRSMISIAKISTVPAYHDSIYDDRDLLEQFDIYLKNHPLSLKACSKAIEKSKLYSKRMDCPSCPGACKHIDVVNESSEIEKLKGFSSLRSKDASCTPPVLHALFSE